MSEEHATLEIIAPTIDEAVSKGLAEFGLPLDSVKVEILDEGSRGLLGIGSRQARVRLTVIDAADEISEGIAIATPPPDEPVAADEPVVEIEQAPEISEAMELEDDVLSIALATVYELLDKMKIDAEVSTYYGESDDPKYQSPVVVDIQGKDLSILIGKRAETLNALQYITRLIVSKEVGRSVFLIVDVEGYRKRREQQITHLANRMAEQAVSTGRRQVLEPMPANERRIVHMVLRENQEVGTQSIGEEPNRKVTILPID